MCYGRVGRDSVRVGEKVRVTKASPKEIDSKVRSHSSSALICVNLPASAVHKKIKERSPFNPPSNSIVLYAKHQPQVKESHRRTHKQSLPTIP